MLLKWSLERAAPISRYQIQSYTLIILQIESLNTFKYRLEVVPYLLIENVKIYYINTIILLGKVIYRHKNIGQ